MLKKSLLVFIILLLSFAVMADQIESEPNDDRGSANGPITFNESLTGGLPYIYGGDSFSPQDYWRFTGIADKTYTFHATDMNCSVYVSPLDLALDIENFDGIIFATKDAGGSCDAEDLSWNCTLTGTYYLIVYEATGTVQAAAWYQVQCQESASGVEDWTLY